MLSSHPLRHSADPYQVYREELKLRRNDAIAIVCRYPDARVDRHVNGASWFVADELSVFDYWCPGEYIVSYGLGERDKSAPRWYVDVRNGSSRYAGTLREIIAAERTNKTEDGQRAPLCLNGKTPILDDGRDGD